LQPAGVAGPARRVVGELQALQIGPGQTPWHGAAQEDGIAGKLDPAQVTHDGARAEPGEQKSEAGEQRRNGAREIEPQQRPQGDGEAEPGPQIVGVERRNRVTQ
jgi:hypothetical protein